MLSRKELGAYARTVADRMGLAHWRMEFPDEPPANEGAHASVNCWHARAGASVRFGDGLLKETPEEQRYCVVHEMVHCHMAHADAIAEKTMGPREAEAWRLAMEYGVDALASVIAPSLPLPTTAEAKAPEGTPADAR